MSVNKKIILGEILDNVYAAYYEDDVLKRIVAGPNDLGGEADGEGTLVRFYPKEGMVRPELEGELIRVELDTYISSWDEYSDEPTVTFELNLKTGEIGEVLVDNWGCEEIVHADDRYDVLLFKRNYVDLGQKGLKRNLGIKLESADFELQKLKEQIESVSKILGVSDV